MALLSSATGAMACMQEITDEYWRMGVLLKTHQPEVAPNQFEFASLYGANTTQIDQNLMVIQIIEKKLPLRVDTISLIASKRNPSTTLADKVNTAANRSIAAESIFLTRIRSWKARAETTHTAFPIVMAALNTPVDEHGDLMRMAISRVRVTISVWVLVMLKLGQPFLSFFVDKKNRSSEWCSNINMSVQALRQTHPSFAPCCCGHSGTIGHYHTVVI